MRKKNNNQNKIYKIINCIAQVFFISITIVFVWMIFAGAFATNLCNEITTCYTIVIFLVGINVTTKFKILDEKNSRVELILFIIGILLNILFLSVAYGYDCFSIKFDEVTGDKIIDLEKVNSAILLLNVTIWIDFIVLIRNIYLITIGYFKKEKVSWKAIKKENFANHTNNSISKSNVIIVLLFILFTFIVIWYIALRKSIKDNSDVFNSFSIAVLAAVISGFCAIVGGFFTLFGVEKTIGFEREKEKKNNEEANKPQIYVPLRYKFDEINEISVNNGDDDSPI